MHEECFVHIFTVFRNALDTSFTSTLSRDPLSAQLVMGELIDALLRYRRWLLPGS